MSTEIQKARSQHPIQAIMKAKEQALAEVVGPAKIKRFMANTLAQISKVDRLAKCTPASFYAAAHQAACLNLQPGPLGHVYLVPYKQTATLIIGYKGMMELARRHPDVLKITADVVYEDEDFEYNKVTGEILKHDSPLGGVDRSDDKLVAAYCRVLIRDCPEPVSEVLDRSQIDSRRERSKAKDKEFWTKNFAAMARKCAVRAIFGGGELPVSEELEQAIDYEIEEEKRIGYTERQAKAEEEAPEIDVSDGFKAEVVDAEAEQEENPADWGFEDPLDENKVDVHKLIMEEADMRSISDQKLTSLASKLLDKSVVDMEKLSRTEQQQVLEEIRATC